MLHTHLYSAWIQQCLPSERKNRLGSSLQHLCFGKLLVHTRNGPFDQAQILPKPEMLPNRE